MFKIFKTNKKYLNIQQLKMYKKTKQLQYNIEI